MKITIWLALLLFCSTGALAACVSPCVQNTSAHTDQNLTSVQLTLASNTTAGHAVVVSVGFCTDFSCSTDPSGPTITVSDNATSNTYTKVLDISTANNCGVGCNVRVVTFLASNTTGGVSGSNVININSSASLDYFTATANEFSGVTATPSDATGTALQTTAGASFSVATTGSPSSTKVIVYSAAADNGLTISAGSGFNILNNDAVLSLADEFKEDLSAGCSLETATWTASGSSTWAGTILTLKETGGSAPSCSGAGGGTAKKLLLLQ